MSDVYLLKTDDQVEAVLAFEITEDWFCGRMLALGHTGLMCSEAAVNLPEDEAAIEGDFIVVTYEELFWCSRQVFFEKYIRVDFRDSREVSR